MSDIIPASIEIASGGLSVNSTRTIRLFLSSTFNDFQAERTALHKKVFPALRSKCEAAGYQFQAIDLRWGVSEEAGRNHKTIDICLEEIRRCQQISPRPNFLVLLGQRYGWQPSPTRIPDEEFRLLVKYITDPIDRQMVEHWYRCDENSIPPGWVLRTRQDDYAAVETRLRNIILVAAFQALIPATRLDHYMQSATGLEILVGALDQTEAPNADQHVHVFTRQIDDLPTNCSSDYLDWDAPHNRIDTEAAARLEQLAERLNHRLPADHHWSYRERWTGLSNADGPNPEITHNHLDELCAQVLKRIGAHIDEQIASTTQSSQHDLERMAHLRFAEERCKHLVGRESALEYVDGFLSDDSAVNSVLLIHGASGCGKSAFLAGALSQYRNNDVQVLARYIGITPLAGSARPLLNNLFQELGGNEVLPEAEENVRSVLSALLTKRPTIIALDAIDQLPTDEARWLLRRLPNPFPQSSRLLLTCSEECLPDLEPFLPDHEEFLLPGLERVNAELLLNAWLSEHPRRCRTVTAQQRHQILEGFCQSGGLPLYLRIAANIAREWFSWTSVQPLPDTLPALIAEFFDNLHQERGHGVLLSSRALALIAASRQGMAEEELIDILGQDAEVLNEYKAHHPNSPPIDGLPPVLWSRLYYDLQPFLSEREAQGRRVLSFFHRQFQEEAARQWLQGKEGLTIHRQIADYFADQELFLDGNERSRVNARKTAQQPWHLKLAGEANRLHALLQDFEFAMAKCQADQIDDFIGSYLWVPAELSGTVRTWADFISDSAHMLRRRTDAWPAHKVLLQLAIEHADESVVTIGAERFLAEGKCNWLWIKRDCRQAHRATSPITAFLEGHNGDIRGIRQLPNGEILTWSGDFTVRIWDESTGLQKFHYENYGQALSLPDGFTLLWSRRYPATGMLVIDQGGALITVINVDNCHNVQVLSDGSLLCFLNRGAFEIWNWKDGKLIRRLIHSTVYMLGAQELSEGRLVSWSNDGRIYFWDLTLSDPINTLQTGIRPIHPGVCINSNGRIITWSSGGLLQLWRGFGHSVELQHEIQIQVEFPLRALSGATFIAEEKILAWNNMGGLYIWMPTTAQPISIIDTYEHETTSRNVSILWLPNGNLATNIQNACTLVWNTQTGEILGTFKGSPIEVWDDGYLLTQGYGLESKFDSDSLYIQDWRSCELIIKLQVKQAKRISDDYIVSIDKANYCRLWEIRTNEAIDTISGANLGPGTILGRLNDSSFAFNYGGVIQIIDVRKFQPLAEAKAARSNFDGYVSLSDDRFAAWSCAQKNIQIVDRTGGAVMNLKTPSDGIRAILPLTKQIFIAVCWYDDLYHWKLADSITCTTLRGHDGLIMGVKQLPNGHCISWGNDGTLILWDADTADAVADVRAHQFGINGADLIPDGRIMSWAEDGSVTLWNPGSPSQQIVVCHDEMVNGSACFAKYISSSYFLRCGGDCSLTLWCTTTGRLIKTLIPRHSSYGAAHHVGEVAGDFIFSWIDEDIYIWDITSFDQIAHLRQDRHSVKGAFLLQDGRLLTWGGDKTLCLWNIEKQCPVLVLDGHTADIVGARVLPNGGILSWSEEEAICWDSSNGVSTSILSRSLGPSEEIPSELYELVRALGGASDRHLAAWGSSPGVFAYWQDSSGSFHNACWHDMYGQVDVLSCSDFGILVYSQNQFELLCLMLGKKRLTLPVKSIPLKNRSSWWRTIC